MRFGDTYQFLKNPAEQHCVLTSCPCLSSKGNSHFFRTRKCHHLEWLPPKEKKYTRILWFLGFSLPCEQLICMNFSKGEQGEFSVQTVVLLPGPRHCYGELAFVGQGVMCPCLRAFSLETLCGGWDQAGWEPFEQPGEWEQGASGAPRSWTGISH